nr:putative ribonuclease H-like domain-containing protein [Tanacetum cinerariifolium]
MQQVKNKPRDHCSTEVLEGSGNTNPTASASNPPADHMKTLTVESPIPTISSPLEDILRGTKNSDESNGEEADISNMETVITASPTPTLRIHKDHPRSQIIGPVDTPIQTKNKSKENGWTLVDCPKGVRPIGTKWVLKNKKDERGIVIRNKARLVAQGYTQGEGIDYDEVFAPVARIKAIRLFLAYASFMGFTVYQMDVKSAFLYGTIDEEVYVMQPPGFQDPEFPAKVYKVEKAMYGLNQAPRAWYGTLSKYLLKNGFQRVLQKKDGIFLSQDKYVGDILKKFGYSDVRSSNTPMDKENPWGKDGTGKDVDLHLYRSMIGSLMYLTASRPVIMFAICACARHQVTPKECHLHAVKRIFRYLKGHPKLGLWSWKRMELNLRMYKCDDGDEGEIICDDGNIRLDMDLLGMRCDEWLLYLINVVRLNSVVTNSIELTRVNSINTELTQYSPNRTSKYWCVLRILMIGLRLIPLFWSTASIETTKEGTKILAIVDGIVRTVSESSLRDVSQGEACPTDSDFIADQDKATIDKSSTLPHDSAPRVTSPAAVEGSMQQTIPELMALCTSLQRQLSEDDAPIKGRSMDEGKAATERVSDDTKEMATVLTSMDAATVLASGVVDVPTGSGSIPTASTPAEGSVPTGSNEVPTASPVFATAIVVTPVTRRKGKEKEDQRRAEQIARDAEIARIYVEEELQSMIDGLDSNNETKSSEEITEEAKSPEEVSEEKVKEMMNLVPIKEVYVEALQVKHPIIDWKVHSEGRRTYWKITSTRPPISDKEMELWVELSRLYEPDKEDQLWTHTQNFMHALVDWKLYDSCGVHHVAAKDKEIFMLVEKDYPLRKGLALVMICYKLQVENFSQMANELVLKIYMIANSPRQQ